MRSASKILSRRSLLATVWTRGPDDNSNARPDQGNRVKEVRDKELKC
jgi:hypothetical protein